MTKGIKAFLVERQFKTVEWKFIGGINDCIISLLSRVVNERGFLLLEIPLYSFFFFFVNIPPVLQSNVRNSVSFLS